MDLFATLFSIALDAPSPKPPGATPTDAIYTNRCDGGSDGAVCVGDLFATLFSIAPDAPSPKPAGATPTDAIYINRCDGGDGGPTCVVA